VVGKSKPVRDRVAHLEPVIQSCTHEECIPAPAWWSNPNPVWPGIKLQMLLE
jgi:hypothetical protein